MSRIKRVFDLLQFNLDNFPKDNFVGGKQAGKWVSYSTHEFNELVDHLSRGLINKGMGKGSKIAVMSPNRPEWNITDFAIMQIGAYQIPFYPTLADQDIRFILKDAEVNMIFVADEKLYLKVKTIAAEFNPLLPIYTIDEVEGAEHWKSLVTAGAQLDTDLAPYRAAVDAEDILTLIYTSGTTGTPKGVMLTHNNLIKNFQNSAVLLPEGIQTALSFLPLSHIFERMIIYLYFYTGVAVYYAESMETIVADIQFVKPNAFTTVPRLLEKVYEKIMEKGKALEGVKKNIFFWSVNLAERFEIENGWFYNLQLSIARKLVFKKWQEALGGNILVIVSGGAALNPRLARIFWAAGMPVFEGYGLTETSPVITVNHFGGNTMFGTVGTPIEGMEIKIAEDGEVLARGHAIMKGYYKREDLTAETIDADGWFHTGDIGEIFDGKFLKITDRKKEIFKTAGGKYVAPQMVENKFKESLMVEQVMVLGENRKFPSALIVPNFVVLKAWAEKKEIPYSTDEEMINHPDVLNKYQQIAEEACLDFGKWEQVKRIALLKKQWTIEGGELTPKLSFKRKIILEKNQHTIDKLYNDAENYKR